jgi:hypothetical protein
LPHRGSSGPAFLKQIDCGQRHLGP